MLVVFMVSTLAHSVPMVGPWSQRQKKCHGQDLGLNPLWPPLHCSFSSELVPFKSNAATWKTVHDPAVKWLYMYANLSLCPIWGVGGDGGGGEQREGKVFELKELKERFVTRIARHQVNFYTYWTAIYLLVMCIIIIINPLTISVVGAPQMILLCNISAGIFLLLCVCCGVCVCLCACVWRIWQNVCVVGVDGRDCW